MNPDVVVVHTDTDQEEAAQAMAKYDLSALPVTDEKNFLVGVITGDDLIDVLQEEATEDIYHLANVTDTGLEPDSPIGMQVRGRLPWLFINTATALFGAWVISNYEDIIAQVAVLAVFQSVIAGQGGNAGAQSVAMIVRALALDKINTQQVWRVMGRQIIVGLIQGIIVGLLVGTIAGVVRGNVYLGLIVFIAMLGNMIISGIIGTLAPMGLKSFGKDPALASSVFVTAVTDSVGFFLFLSLATHYLPVLK
jgi:magnesium transporter